MVGGCGPHLKEDAAAPAWSCCFVPPQSSEIAQINLLFAWLGQYVCVLCACVCKCMVASDFPFILIECSGVTTGECPTDYLHRVFPKGFFCMAVNCVCHVYGFNISGCLCRHMHRWGFAATLYRLFLCEHVCKEHTGHAGGSLSCNELYWFYSCCWMSFFAATLSEQRNYIKLPRF